MNALLVAYRLGYERLARPVVFRASAQTAHTHMIRLLRGLDRLSPALFRGARRAVSEQNGPVTVGGVTLDQPLILSAGLVKGDGFGSEADALVAVARGLNIIPGWRSLPPLVGPVEFGSFTRWPRLGNPGAVVWRDLRTCSTQNRVGLKNPGAAAAAAFLGQHARELPAVFGINVAVSPGVIDPDQQQQEVLESLGAFVAAGVRPAWFTLNLSCPNTEDDPCGHQTEHDTRQLCRAVIDTLAGRAPLWVKVGPTLADAQYAVLKRVFAETGVQAVIATNTQPEPVPGDPSLVAGVGGGRLHARAVQVASLLAGGKGYPVDVIGCGGVSDGASYHDFARLGIGVVQYWSVLIYRGPLAAAVIAREIREQRQ